MFEMEDKQTILNRLIKYYGEVATSGTHKIEGGFNFDTLSANAKEFEKAYAEMVMIKEAFFPQTSWGDFLTMGAEIHGIIRQDATKAIVTLTVTGTAGVIVKKNSLFATDNGKNFLTIEDVTIEKNGTAEVKAEAQTAGSNYNVATNTIVKIPMSIYGVQSVMNNEAAHDGYEEESDSDLLERLLFKVRQPATSGNVNHYILWATSVEGVGAVKVLPLWNGNGTVKVIITNAINGIASDDLVDKVKNYIDEQAPIGATLTVASPTPLPINISLKVTDGIGSIDGIKTIVNSYLIKLTFTAKYVSLAQIGKVILEGVADTGVKDYDDLMLNGQAENVPIKDDELPTVGEVILID